MTVTGVLSADVAQGTYVPPFKYVTSYAQSPEVTGSVNPTVTASSNAAYATAYLQAHMMSWPSYRYAYLLWFVLIALAGVYALSHHLRLSGGSVGAAFKKWGIRRKPVGRRKSGGARGMALPSNSALMSIGIITIISCVLVVIGSDYIKPSSSTFNFSSSFRKRASSIPYSISKSWWTSGSRFGFTAFALMPLTVLFALKAPPIAIFALRAFTHIYSDKLALFHRATAWIVWGFTTIHVALWTVQLFQDQQKGRAVWFLIWNSYRFIFGCVAYAAMTAVMVLSLKPVRKNSYEVSSQTIRSVAEWSSSSISPMSPVLFSPSFVRLAKINGMFGKKRGSYDALAGKPYKDSTQTYGMQDLKRSSDYEKPYTDKTLPQPPPQQDQSYETNDFGRTTNRGYYDEGSLQPLGAYESRYDPPIHQRSESTATMLPMPRSDSATSMHLPRSSSMTTMGNPSQTPALPSFIPVPIPVGYAQAQLLPSRTVRLTINVPRPFKWSPGQSVLLYLPEISRFQSHPFTITNNDSNEIILLVKARKGLTKQLFDLVRTRSLAAMGINNVADKRVSLRSMQSTNNATGLQVPPIFLKAWVDGPMGSSGRVKWKNYSTVLIICGGSGVSFGASICEYICRRMKNSLGKTQRVRFCWVVREYAEIAWIAGQLRRCQDMVDPTRFEISIFVTNSHQPRNNDELAPPRPGFAQGTAHQRRGSTDSVTSQMSIDGDPNQPMDYDDTVDGHLSSNYADIIDLTNYEDEEDVNDPAENQLSQTLNKQGKVLRAKSRKAQRRTRGSIEPSNSPLYPPNRNQQQTAYDNPHSRFSASYDDPPRQLSAYDDYSQRLSSSSYDEHNPPKRPSAYEDRFSGHSQASSLHAPQPHPASAPMLANSSSNHQLNYDRRQSYRSYADSTYDQYNPFGGGGGYSMGPSPSPSIMNFDDGASTAGESVRDLLSRASRTQSMVLLEEFSSSSHDPNHTKAISSDGGLWIDESDYAAMKILTEKAKNGKPKLSSVIEEEVVQAKGNMIVATCGPVTLNTVIRNLVSKHISPSKIRRGDERGQIDIYTEDYEA
ncbi:uncharacterized protein IL334_007078 [Kwoniella shivajii]|uniref:ferric-chelate reductase (NADPH) n=1 Tax=Kwoniella shivajii TaxID=564305 RepID=A0ABZ1D9X9_9TREE|nr:hypothetical protein IL334_007078 [Kwoniella shivajii]